MDYSSSFKEADLLLLKLKKKFQKKYFIADFLGKGKKAEDILEEMQVLSPQKSTMLG